MPLDPNGYRVISTAEFFDTITQEWNSRLVAQGLPALDFDDTIEGAQALAFAEVLYRVSQNLLFIYLNDDPRTAVGKGLDRMFPGQRRAATSSIYPMQVTRGPGGGFIIPAGWTIQGGSPDDLQAWEVDPSFVGAPLPAGATTVVPFFAVDTGPITIQGPDVVSFNNISPAVPDLVSIQFDPGAGGTIIVGRDEETDAEFRARMLVLGPALAAATHPAITQAILSLSWVQSASVSFADDWTIQIVVSPAPTTDVDPRFVELRDTIARVAGFPSRFYQAMSGNVDAPYSLPGAEQTDWPIRWSAPTTQDVAVGFSVEVEAGSDSTEVVSAAESAIVAWFATLNKGVAVRVADIAAVLATVVGVRDVPVGDILLDGAGASVFPPNGETTLATNPGIVTGVAA